MRSPKAGRDTLTGGFEGVTTMGVGVGGFRMNAQLGEREVW